MAGSRLLTVLLAALAWSAAAADPLVDETRPAVKSFAETLKGQLVAALQEGGPVHAIGVCNVIAPGIAESESAATGWDVARTSLRWRNPDNAPDAWELRVLHAFEARLAAGEAVGSLEYSELFWNGDQSFMRYMKAIPTGEVCLTCHGGDLAPDLVAALDALYPDDRARGFALGDIRGAFTITRPVNWRRFSR